LRESLNRGPELENSQGHKQTSRHPDAMSALPAKADID
jgi:hypothetical protein